MPAGRCGAWGAADAGCCAAGRCGACGACGPCGPCGPCEVSGRAATELGRGSLVTGRELTTRRGSSAVGAAGATGAAAPTAGADGGAGAVATNATAGAAGSAGCSDAGRVGATCSGAVAATAGAVAATSAAGAETTGLAAAGSSVVAGSGDAAPPESARLTPAAFLAGGASSDAPDAGADFFAATFLPGLVSSGWSGRVSPSRSARRRNRSAWASMIDEDWLLASTPIVLHRSSTSVLVIPSSFASSCTRMFFAKLIQPFIGVGLPEALPAAVHSFMCDGVDSNAICSLDSAPGPRVRRHARSKPRRFTAVVKHPGVHSHAPRPGAVRLMSASPSGPTAQRIISDCGNERRQPMQVRIGWRTRSGSRFVATLLF